MVNTKRKTLRFYLDNPTHKKAWDYLQTLDKSRFKSFNDTVAIAVADFFENQEREERFIKRIVEHISLTTTQLNPHFYANSQTTANPQPQTSLDDDINEYIDFDFLGS